jgi:hypothetical protein
MATMHPPDVERFHTEGEESVYRWLQQVAKPNADFMVFYNPDAEDREPDFLLYHDSVGIVVLEVKDWVMDQVLSADPLNFRLETCGNQETRTNPLRQAREHQNAVMHKIKKDHRLLSTDPLHRGHAKIPMDHGVVFTNINRQEFVDAGLCDVIPEDKAFFFDDLAPTSPLLTSTPPGSAFAADLARRFPPLFPCCLTGQEKKWLGGVLWPQAQVRLPRREGGTAEHQAECERLRTLDHNQEAIALRLDGGHRLITGPSGSGKTLVLAHKAAHLLKYDPAVKRVLFVCYNMTLVRYIRRLLAQMGTPLGTSGVEVVHFFELCSNLLGEPVEYEGPKQDYYDTVVALTLDRLTAGAASDDAPPRYDAILVDEGQDFSDDMVRVIVALLNPQTNNLTIALDESQNIYRRRTSPWIDLGVQVRGRTTALRATYRNTREITAFAAKFVADAPADGAPARAGQLALDNVYAPSGPEPELRRHKTFADALASLGPQIRKLQDECGYPLSEFAVLYPMRTFHGATDIDLPLSIQAALDSAGMLWRWASKDSRSKTDYDIAADSVTISTVHSVKGLDFVCVFLVGFDFLEPSAHWSEEQTASLAYVAVTRARTRLYVPYVQEGWVIRRMVG